METQNPVEVIRETLRETALTKRKDCRTLEINKRRAALGEGILDNEQGWSLDKVIVKAKELRKKTLTIEDYRQLQASLIQEEENINGFLSVDNIISALVRDLSSSNPAIRLSAVNCCCNLALGNRKSCASICKHAGPYLVAQLDCWNNPLLEVCVWTIGNLCNGSKTASEALHAQGCFKRLLSLLKECEATILPSLNYAITHCLYSAGSKNENISEGEIVTAAEIITSRLKYVISVDTLWLLALLSSTMACQNVLIPIMPTIFEYLVMILDKDSTTSSEITAIIRLFANTILEPSGIVANIFLDYHQDTQKILNTLLVHEHLHIRKELLWFIGNMFKHTVLPIRQKTRELLDQLPNLGQAVQSVKNAINLSRL